MTANRYHHLSWLNGVDLFEAAFSSQTFSRHAHEGFSIGAIAEGAGGYVCRGERMVLPAGTLSLMNPEEPHTGHAAAGHVRYNMLYVTEEAVRDLLAPVRLRGFAEIAPPDRGLLLRRALTSLARRLNAAPHPDWRLAAEEAVHEVLALAFTHYGRADLRPAGHEPVTVARLREEIAAGVDEGRDLTLGGLAASAGLSPSYFIRSIARETGMTPHAHVLRCRVTRARSLLLQGVPAAEAALAAGFCDQAHMIRQFRRQLGVTPGSLVRH
ncbi:MAG: AraC family transcriptional regulator [Stappia sp.]|uniref:AraC family transcriptional regulator n=1 Tax=Stappia sp. TaxID=1870903 RepID=UPI000C3E3F17|nr:AraC family transcriptional regulator [Stappia sp.]MAA97545.1 AraC family transcriptional regulator [Stappia sp.]MBM22078.1 AraC family transcriptional regulator [Stappia sp.]